MVSRRRWAKHQIHDPLSDLWQWPGTALWFSSVCLPQIDGQMKVVNQSLGNCLRSLIGKKQRQWNQILSHVKFSYNSSRNRSIQMSPFEIVYKSNPTKVLDLVPIEKPKWNSGDVDAMANEITARYEVRSRIEASDHKYKADADRSQWQQEFAEGNLVWVFLHKERFHLGSYKKLKERKIRSNRINRRIGDNAYQVQLLSQVQTLNIFNVAGSTPYAGDAPAAQPFNVKS